MGAISPYRSNSFLVTCAQKGLESFGHTVFAQHTSSSSAHIWSITSDMLNRDESTTRHASSPFSSSLMCFGFCWLGATHPSHQTAAPRLGLRGLTLIEWPNYPIVLSMKALPLLAQRPGMRWVTGWSLACCPPRQLMKGGRGGACGVNVTFKELPVGVMSWHQCEWGFSTT